MNNEQIFISYSRENRVQVEEINQKIRDEGYTTWLDVSNGFPGEEFNDAIPNMINKSELFLVFLSKERKDPSYFNFELELIEKRRKFFHSSTKPVIIPILLDPADELVIDSWLNIFTFIEFFKNKEKAYEELFKTLSLWANYYKIKPPYISALASDKHKQEPESKRRLAKWVENYVKANWKNQSILLGCGTTVYDIWFYQLRKSFLANSNAFNKLHTINDFILYNESEQKKHEMPYISVNQIGDIHDKAYAAYRYDKPENNFPALDSALVSVAGFNIVENESMLNVCWESLVPTIREVFNKVHKEILIVAAGRKLIEPEGSSFLNLSSLKNSGRKITIVIDNHINKDWQAEFEDKVLLMNEFFGECTRQENVLIWVVDK